MERKTIYKFAVEPDSFEERARIAEEILSNPSDLKEYEKVKNAKALFSKNIFTEEEVDNVFNKTKLQVSSRRKTIQINWLRYAAIFVGLFAISFLLKREFELSRFFNNVCAIEVPFGETATLTLPDGSQVWLNSGSRIEYKANFGIRARDIQVVGEGYFSVKKNTDLPFIVHTDKIDIRVTGTQFNVSNYSDDDFIRTTLAEGEVIVENKKGKELCRLKPSEQLILNKKRQQFKVEKVNLKNYTSWKDGVLYFENVPFAEVLSNIERWYNVEIILEDPDIAKELFSGAVMKNKPLFQILDVLCIASDIVNYKIIHNPDAKNKIILK